MGYMGLFFTCVYCMLYGISHEEVFMAYIIQFRFLLKTVGLISYIGI